MTSELPASLFIRDGDYITPTAASRGPWADDALHGGPASALLAHLCETVRPPAAAPLQTTRMTVELLAPVPLAPLRPEVVVVRDGRKIRLVDAHLFSGDRMVATARVAQIRTAHMALPDNLAEREGPRIAPPRQPAASIKSTAIGASEVIRYHSHSTEHRFASGQWGDLGPAFGWVRLTVPVFENVPLSPMVRVAAAADFGNGISAPLTFEDWLFINPDLTVHLSRMPVGEWVGLDAHCYVEPHGIGQSNTELFDETGRIGHANQSLLIDTR